MPLDYDFITVVFYILWFCFTDSHVETKWSAISRFNAKGTEWLRKRQLLVHNLSVYHWKPHINLVIFFCFARDRQGNKFGDDDFKWSVYIQSHFLHAVT